MFKRRLLLLVTLFPVISFATDNGWHYLPGSSSDPNAQFHERFPGNFYDDVTADQLKSSQSLTPEQKHQALIWGLSDAQERRYVQLMQNRSQVYYRNRNVSPVEVLGINARDDQERTYYANLTAAQESMRIAKELAFFSDFNHAYGDLMAQYKLPVLKPFDVKKYSPYNYQPIELQVHDKLMLFVHLKDSVKPIVGSLMALIVQVPDVQLNIYFVDKVIKNADVQAWAKSQDIPSVLVMKQTITLNMGSQSYNVHNKDTSFPGLFLIRNHGTSQINMDRF